MPQAIFTPNAVVFGCRIPNLSQRKTRHFRRDFLWLGRRFLNITFSMQEDDPIVDVEEIRELLDEEIKEGDNE